MISHVARAAGLAVLIGAMAIPGAAPVMAQTERVAVHTDWSVFNPTDPEWCYIATPPTASVARRDGQVVQVDRGEIRLFVTFRPDENVVAEVSYTSGYPIREGSVALVVNGEEFALRSGEGEGDRWAWPASPAEDARLIAAFRRGSDARVRAVSTRGTSTEDTFSLMGFTAALNDAQGRCS